MRVKTTLSWVLGKTQSKREGLIRKGTCCKGICWEMMTNKLLRRKHNKNLMSRD